MPTLLYRRPELAAWAAVLLFSTSAELRLRVDPTIGVLKDALVALLVALVAVAVWQRPAALRRLRGLALPAAALALLVGLYALDPAGDHGTSWIFGTRLLIEVLALLVAGAVLAPRTTLVHLVRAMVVVLPLEAVFAWVQQAAGPASLIYRWGYEYGSQVRSTSSGGVRTSGTFEDPFQLAALAVLGLALALFVASRWQAAVLIVSAVAVLGATSVRTAMLQAGLLLVVYAVQRGYGREAASLAAVAAVAGVFFLATTTSAVRPGAPEEPLLFTLNGRSDAWALAVDGWESLVTGNGVGARGTGSTRTSVEVSGPPRFDGSRPGGRLRRRPGVPRLQLRAGAVRRRDRRQRRAADGAGRDGGRSSCGGCAPTPPTARRGRPPACSSVSVVDWIGRSSLASYTTGFLTLYVLGVLLGAVRNPGAKP